MSQIKLFPQLKEKIEKLEQMSVPAERKELLQPLIDFIQKQKDSGNEIKLNFICTHNSRRSQFGQIWAKAISAYYNIETECFSGGTETTSFNENAVEALKRAGFRINHEEGKNPHFKVKYAENAHPIVAYSKLYDAGENPSENFAALMTCSHADANCPFIAGAAKRIALDYQDPKEFDGSAQEKEKYSERSDQIASEMIYVFKNIKQEWQKN